MVNIVIAILFLKVLTVTLVSNVDHMNQVLDKLGYSDEVKEEFKKEKVFFFVKICGFCLYFRSY